MTRDELIDALTAERFNNRWWVTPTVDDEADDELTTARRRRHLAADFERINASEREVL